MPRCVLCDADIPGIYIGTQTDRWCAVVLQTNLSNFTGTTYRNVSRSYYEFQQFYDAIVHSNPQTIIPALPLAQTSAPTDEEDDRLVKIMLQRWLARICDDPILVTEEEVRSFIESDFGYQPTPAPKRKTSSGFSLIRRAVPDEDEELQRARFELTKLETQFFDAAKAIDKLAKARKCVSVGLSMRIMSHTSVIFGSAEHRALRDGQQVRERRHDGGAPAAGQRDAQARPGVPQSV